MARLTTAVAILASSGAVVLNGTTTMIVAARALPISLTSSLT
jgi:hypothetical protein